MSPDHDPPLQEAFAQLGRRMRVQAPPFAVMRNRALDAARDGAGHSAAGGNWSRAAALVPALCGLVLALLWLPHGAPRDPMPSTGSAERQRVESLLAGIERQLAVNDAVLDPVYPTDFLIPATGNKTEP